MTTYLAFEDTWPLINKSGNCWSHWRTGSMSLLMFSVGLRKDGGGVWRWSVGIFPFGRGYISAPSGVGAELPLLGGRKHYLPTGTCRGGNHIGEPVKGPPTLSPVWQFRQ